MKIKDIFPESGANVKKAKKIRMTMKDKAKENNPGESEHRGGWAVDAHQGTYNSLRMTR